MYFWIKRFGSFALKKTTLLNELFFLHIKYAAKNNNLIHPKNGFYTKDVYYGDTGLLYLENNKHWDKLDKAGLIGKNLLQGENDYKDGGIFNGLFLALKKILFNYK